MNIRIKEISNLVRLWICWLHVIFLAQKNRSELKKNRVTEKYGIGRKKDLQVLVIDDEDRYRRSLRFRLTHTYGATVTDVGSGPEALQALEAGNIYDVIFLDISMPGMNGIETYRALQSYRPDCFIVMMSAFVGGDLWREAETLGLPLVSKPILESRMYEILIRLER